MRSKEFFVSRAILGPNQFSTLMESSRGGCTEGGWFREKRREGEIRFARGRPAGVLRIRREFSGERRTARSDVCAMSGNAARIHEFEAGPAFLGAPFARSASLPHL